MVLDPNDKNKIESCANGSHKICKDAKKIALQTYCNRLTDGEDYFLYIGESLGELGLKYSDYVSIEDSDLKRTMQSVKDKRIALQLNQSPALHIQSIYEY